MTAETLKNSLKDVQNLKMRTKATKFSRLFQSDPTVTIEEAPLEEILEQCNLLDYVKKEEVPEDVSENEQSCCDSESAEDSEISDYIVDDPSQVIVSFPIVSNIDLEEKLPFFRSLSLKLASL